MYFTFYFRSRRPPLGGHVVGRLPSLRVTADLGRDSVLLVSESPRAGEGKDQTRGESGRR